MVALSWLCESLFLEIVVLPGQICAPILSKFPHAAKQSLSIQSTWKGGILNIH